MQHVRAIHLVTLGAALACAGACDPPTPALPQYFEASFPPRERTTDWRRVDPELRAAGIRLHVDIEGAKTSDSLDEVDRSLDSMATALDRLPPSAATPGVAAASRHIHESARLLANGIHNLEERRALIKDALDSAAWAMLALAGYDYAFDPSIGDRVARFRASVDAIETTRVGLPHVDIFAALVGGREAFDGFLLAIANGNLRAR